MENETTKSFNFLIPFNWWLITVSCVLHNCGLHNTVVVRKTSAFLNKHFLEKISSHEQLFRDVVPIEKSCFQNKRLDYGISQMLCVVSFEDAESFGTSSMYQYAMHDRMPPVCLLYRIVHIEYMWCFCFGAYPIRAAHTQRKSNTHSNTQSLIPIIVHVVILTTKLNNLRVNFSIH